MNGQNMVYYTPDICDGHFCPGDCDEHCPWVDKAVAHIEANNAVNHPDHYTAGKIECIDAMESAVTGLSGMDAVLTAQVLKYLWRWKKKNGLEDLRKAAWYLNRLIERTDADGR